MSNSVSMACTAQNRGSKVKRKTTDIGDGHVEKSLAVVVLGGIVDGVSQVFLQSPSQVGDLMSFAQVGVSRHSSYLHLNVQQTTKNIPSQTVSNVVYIAEMEPGQDF